VVSDAQKRQQQTAPSASGNDALFVGKIGTSLSPNSIGKSTSSLNRASFVYMQLPQRPRIPARFAWFPISSNEFRIHSLTYSLAVKDSDTRLLSQLLPLLNGEHTLDGIFTRLASFGEESVARVLEHLCESGVLEDADRVIESSLSSTELARYSGQIGFFEHFSAEAQRELKDAWPGIPASGVIYQERIRRAHIGIFGLGRLGSQLLRLLAIAGVGAITGVDEDQVTESEVYSDSWFAKEHLGLARSEVIRELIQGINPGLQFQIRASAWKSKEELASALSGMTFAVLALDYFNPAEYTLFNQVCLDVQTPWTSCRMCGFEFQIGPTVIPFSTPCFECFDSRLKSNLPDYAEHQFFEEYLRRGKIRSEMLAITPGLGLVALEVLKAITQFMPPATYANLFVLNLLDTTSKLHPILKVPRCPGCSPAARGRPDIHVWQQLAVTDADETKKFSGQ
jgi:bacteriocin biosynthesis cyclodehydratase domain-containing protein